MTHFDNYLKNNSGNIGLWTSLVAMMRDAKEAIAELPKWERGFHVFWLLGPFILLIERSPADLWISLLALTFVIRSIIKGDGVWLKPFWVKAGFAFWIWCIIAGAVSDFPVYSVGEAIVWFRFPLFAMATSFWLARDKRLLYTMLISTALGLLVMCGILTAEIMVVGQQGGRLSWPYGDLVPGNYVAKVGLPAFTIMVALAVSVNGRVAALLGIIALFTMAISVMTGERINFLIHACAGMLAGLVWKPKWVRYLGLVALEVTAVAMIFSALPGVASRYMDQFIAGATNPKESVWLKTINGGWQLAQDNLMLGIGTGNYRLVSYEGILDKYENVRPDVHPHNFYVQMLLETGLIGLILGVVFLWSIIWLCFMASLKNRENVFVATAWIIPFGLFWPIATTADFFGQWNNIFMWSAVALAISGNYKKIYFKE